MIAKGAFTDLPFCSDLNTSTLLKQQLTKTTTKGEDIYLAIKEMLSKRGIEPKQVISITTDGAPAMIGREKGAVARLSFAPHLSDEYAEVMKTMMKIINFLRASSSCQHRMLREFLKEVDANSDDLLLHNNVGWLSKGRVLERFWSIRREVTAFLEQLESQKAANVSVFLNDEKNMGIVAFLADIMSHLNGLNLQLQGKNNFICDLMTAVRSIQRKLQVFKEDLQGDYTHFPKVKEQVQGHRDVSSFVDFVDKLIENFSKRFDSFSIGEELTLFIQNPFLITDVRAFTNDVTHHFKWANTGPQMIDLQADVALKEQFARTESTTFLAPDGF
ncbi:hypothetical protein NFI96_031536 [Prochilodus magdalenae]|nr:hypothetical protein NFI96_031536 [Prochilodus magdalenae]